MFRKIMAHLLIVALCLLFIGVPDVAAKSKEEKAAEFAAKVKTEIAKLGIGPDARIEVKLRDKTKLKGYVSQAGAESFFVTVAKTGAETEIPYPAVTQVKGNNLHSGVIIALSVGITLAVLFILAYALRD
ncbi:MAG: hypothetical protein JST84_19705 [Acidobacteria bacterium]|nr:hypothetical protein [Acidobacteriota bacterium]